MALTYLDVDGLAVTDDTITTPTHVVLVSAVQSIEVRPICTPPQWLDAALEWAAAIALGAAAVFALSREDLTATAILGLGAFLCARRAAGRSAVGLPTVWIVVIHVGGREITCWHSRDEQYSRQAAARILAAVLGSTP